MSDKESAPLYILIISDDWSDGYCSHGMISRLIEKINAGEYYGGDWLRFNTTLVTSFERVLEIPSPLREAFHAVLVDYGLIGGIFTYKKDELAISILQDFYAGGKKLAWCGAVPHYANKSIQKLYPKAKFLHNLDWANLETDRILALLYRIFGQCELENLGDYDEP